MTPYEQGFLTKCAEYGVDGRELLEKLAYSTGAAGFNEKYRPSGSGRVIGTLNAGPGYRWPMYDETLAGAVAGVRRGQDFDSAATKGVGPQNDAAGKLINYVAAKRYPVGDKGMQVKDNLDLANMQSDAIRRRRGTGRTLLFNKETGKYE